MTEATISNTVVSAGRYRGIELDNSSRRSIVLRDASTIESVVEQRQRSAFPKEVVVDYFYHAGQYWTAVIPTDGVESILGQSFNFSQPKTRKGPEGPEIRYRKSGSPQRRWFFLNHLQTRFRLAADRPVRLYPVKTEAINGAPAQTVDDIVYSLEAVGPPGVYFNIRDAFGGNMISAHRFLSTKEMVFERLATERQWLYESLPLPLTENEKQELLIRSLLRSHNSGDQERYYMFRLCGTNNCTSNPFQILDSAVRYSPWRRLWSWLYRLPLSPRFYLRMRGMDPDPSYRKLVRDEFREYIEDPETQQRKRDVVRQRVKNERRRRAER